MDINDLKNLILEFHESTNNVYYNLEKDEYFGICGKVSELFRLFLLDKGIKSVTLALIGLKDKTYFYNPPNIEIPMNKLAHCVVCINNSIIVDLTGKPFGFKEIYTKNEAKQIWKIVRRFKVDLSGFN